MDFGGGSPWIEPFRSLSKGRIDIMTKKSGTSLSRLALGAAAFINSANRFNLPELKIEADKKNVKALQRVRTALKYPKHIRSNDLLYAVLHLSVSEVSPA